MEQERSSSSTPLFRGRSQRRYLPALPPAAGTKEGEREREKKRKATFLESKYSKNAKVFFSCAAVPSPFPQSPVKGRRLNDAEKYFPTGQCRRATLFFSERNHS
ncbi:hypothetical protein ABVT39_023321 [Epinephelus coioides]